MVPSTQQDVCQGDHNNIAYEVSRESLQSVMKKCFEKVSQPRITMFLIERYLVYSTLESTKTQSLPSPRRLPVL